MQKGFLNQRTPFFLSLLIHLGLFCIVIVYLNHRPDSIYYQHPLIAVGLIGCEGHQGSSTISALSKNRVEGVRGIEAKLEENSLREAKPSTLESSQSLGKNEKSGGMRAQNMPEYLAHARRKIMESIQQEILNQGLPSFGNLELKLLISKTGQIKEVSVNSSSGRRDLDNLALRGAAKAGPFDPVSGENFLENEIQLLLPVRFKKSPVF